MTDADVDLHAVSCPNCDVYALADGGVSYANVAVGGGTWPGLVCGDCGIVWVPNVGTIPEDVPPNVDDGP